MYTGSEIAEMSQLATQYRWYVYIICVQCSWPYKETKFQAHWCIFKGRFSSNFDLSTLCLPSNKQFGYV